MQVILSASARSELADIWSYIAIDDPKAADRAIDRIVKALERLATFPLSGRPREELARGLLSYVVRPRHTVFYRIKGERLEVVHVLHHARDLSRIFANEQ